MTRLRRVASTTFKSIRTRNYRLWFIGQMISVSGTWMQSIALGMVGAPARSACRPGDRPGPQHRLAIPSDAAVRGVGRAHRRPLRQAPDPLRDAGLCRRARARSRGPDRDGGRPPLAGLPAGSAPRVRQPVRQPDPTIFRGRDGRTGRPAERGEPEQHRHERSPGHRPRYRRSSHRHGGPCGLFRGECGFLRSGDRRPGDDAQERAACNQAHRARQGPASRRFALRLEDAGICAMCCS